MLLRRWDQGLHDVDVTLAAVGEQLRLQAVVAEPLDVDGRPAHPEVAADAVGKRWVSRPAEDDDIIHFEPSLWGVSRAIRTLADLQPTRGR